MAIHPRYSRAILAGKKLVEFRKRTLAADIRTVLIYETAPTQRIVGEFSVQGLVLASPSSLWQEFASVGCIDAVSFTSYYSDREDAVGITIMTARQYVREVALAEVVPAPAVPQSFAYLSLEVLEQVRSMAEFEPADEASLVSA